MLLPLSVCLYDVLTYLLDIAKSNPHAPELNVLVVGMPNVGKSTLLNALRATGIPGRKLSLQRCYRPHLMQC